MRNVMPKIHPIVPKMESTVDNNPKTSRITNIPAPAKMMKQRILGPISNFDILSNKLMLIQF